ncbi:hypothetical protein RhiirC2_802131 [Rhizophagus irregularis]|uniref:Uncharacterized protein n=1 Tax=Rhizophagus irregularis TaxID=588596 RepID=A0A2N1M1P4_9GLOM|nr:hypothetical protein RhiirC2_802131 [Rhizophagus irregularis]
MKIETMRRQLPNPIRFIIDYILSWPEIVLIGLVVKSIDRTHSRDNGVRVYQYILDRSKIIAKLCESGLGDMEEFSDIPQDDLPENETTDIPIFNVPETIPQK